jgi:Matrixin
VEYQKPPTQLKVCVMNFTIGGTPSAVPVPNQVQSTPTVDIITALFKLGWALFPTIEQALAGTTPTGLSWLKTLYAIFHGLQTSGMVDDHILLPRMCNHPDVMPLTTDTPRWPVPAGETFEISWTIEGSHPSFSAADFLQCAENAWSRWAAVANLAPVYQPNSKTANVIMTVKYIDGQYGVLGESQLPYGNVTQLTQWFDTGDKFSAFDGPKPNQIDIVRVMTHELGHILGMNHIGTGNLLAPVYNDNVWLPQAGDIAEMQARYPGGPVTPPPSGAAYNLHLDTSGNLSIDGYRLTKLP